MAIKGILEWLQFCNGLGLISILSIPPLVRTLMERPSTIGCIWNWCKRKIVWIFFTTTLFSLSLYLFVWQRRIKAFVNPFWTFQQNNTAFNRRAVRLSRFVTTKAAAAAVEQWRSAVESWSKISEYISLACDAWNAIAEPRLFLISIWFYTFGTVCEYVRTFEKVLLAFCQHKIVHCTFNGIVFHSNVMSIHVQSEISQTKWVERAS